MRPEYRKPKAIEGLRKSRRCLMCYEQFNSEGIHNRICRRCQGSQVWRDGC